MANNLRISRICWNTEGWITPSGPEGKSENKDSYEYMHGFGHEEWLFDSAKTIDGYRYSFLQPISTEKNPHAGKVFDILLYTIDSESKQRYWIGRINNVEVLSVDRAAEIKKIYTAKKWLQEMNSDIEDYTDDKNILTNTAGINIFNIKFKPEDLEIFEERILADGPIVYVSRYTFINYLPKYFNLDEIHANNKKIIITDYQGPLSPLEPSAKKKFSLPDHKEDDHLHENIVRGVIKELRKTYSTVGKEIQVGYKKLRLDIAVQDKSKLIVYEVKSYTSAFISIRVALGQLFEYSFRPTTNRIDEMIIVSHLPDSRNGEIAKYMDHLRKTLGVKIYYQQYSMSDKKLMQKL